MSINLSRLFHHTPVQTQNIKIKSLDVLKEATSQLMDKLQEVKQSAEKLDSSEVGAGSKTDHYYKKLNRECNRIIVNGKKLEKNGLLKNYNAIAHDTLKLNLNLDRFIGSTKMTKQDQAELLNLRDVVGSAVKSQTSTSTSNGIDLNGTLSEIAKMRNRAR
ncbi:hypothetical protein AC791_05320 [Klebsiella sp. RIT-PI-d]|uniref:hypothetical protein n=1 Tax=Klebsiella sp. RIT-PI-d TaxID=1681196 RepID=UPI0006767E32|nr:hypothetical protein [Klebsiella sp. RIT-PI-d]KNC11353.1 hypothetical protein AC791_05320 [Klebsiella sp. RIT-PI-d]